MKNNKFYQDSVLNTLNRYREFFDCPEDYQTINTHHEARQIVLKKAECWQIIRNLSHFYENTAGEALAGALFNLQLLCLEQKVEHCFRNKETIKTATALFREYIENLDINSTLNIIPPEITAAIQNLHNLLNLADTKGNSSESAVVYNNEYNIRIWPSESVFVNGLDMVGVLEELRKLGKASVNPLLDKIPPLEDLDPEKCYLGWEINLNTDAELNMVKDVLIFLEYDSGSSLEIEEVRHFVEKPAEADIISPTVPEAQIQQGLTVSPKTENNDEAKNVPQAEGKTGQKDDTWSTIRVSAAKLDIIVNLVGEIVTSQSKLTQISSKINNLELSSLGEELERLTNELRTQSISLRMLPVSVLFKRFNRLVHDLSHELNKEVELSFEGEETELDKSVIEKLYDPLIHLIRNSIDHGIEDPETRKKENKPAAGHIVLSAFQSGPEVYVQIKDDGAGINLEKVRNKGIERGMVHETDKLTDKQTMNLIFAPGFSTADNVSAVSGRGVGMDVVKSNVESLRGNVDIASKEGLGTTITLKLPLTLAIIDGLLVEVGNEQFILPLSIVEECIEFKEEETEHSHSHSRRIINLRGSAVPFINMNQFFEIPKSNQMQDKMVVIRDENEGFVGLIVNSIIGQHQTVIKPLGRLYQDRKEFSGATILGDGSVALIIDPARLVISAENFDG